MESIIISGATGFLGSHVRDSLPGFRVICLVRPHFGGRIKGCDVWRMGERAPRTNAAAFIHCAASTDPEQGAHNVELTRHMLAVAREQHVKRFIFISSYLAQTDSDTSYAAGKRQEEELVKASGMEYTIFRPTTIYGPGDRSNLANIMTAVDKGALIPLPGGGTAVMQPIFVKDLARLIRDAISSGSARNKTYAVGGTRTTLRDIVATIARMRGKRARTITVPAWMLRTVVGALHLLRMAPIHPSQVSNVTRDGSVDLSAARKDLGFTPTAFEQGMRETLS